MFKRNNIYFLIILLVHVVLASMYIGQRDICSDEPGYIEYAKRWLHGQPERIEPLDDSKTPITVIAWLPRIIEQLKHKDITHNDWGKSDQEAGRYVMIFFTLLTAFYVFCWSKKLLGERWSLLPVILFLFDPLVLGHSGVIGSDVASAAVYIALLFHLWQYLREKKIKDILLMSFFLGLASITKQNLILLLFIVPLICLFHHCKTKSFRSFFSGKNMLAALGSLMIVLLVINAAFYFHGSLLSLASYHFESATFINLQKQFSVLGKLPLFLPEPFIKGFDMLQYHAQIGGGQPLSTYNGVFALGQESMIHGFWFYYFAMGILKMPLPIILLCSAGFIKLLLQIIKRRNKIATDTIVLILPMLFFFGVLSLFNPFQIGIRHIIFLLPSLYLLLAIYVKQLMQHKNKTVLAVFALWQFISIATYFNNYIAYTNELAYNKTKILNWISDSSIDYEQNNSSLKKYLLKHPEFKLPDSLPNTGWFAVRAVKVLHINKQEPDKYAWLRENFKPYSNYKRTIWLYHIDGTEFKK